MAWWVVISIILGDPLGLVRVRVRVRVKVGVGVRVRVRVNPNLREGADGEVDVLGLHASIEAELAQCRGTPRGAGATKVARAHEHRDARREDAPG